MKNAHFLCLAMLCVILSLVSQGLPQNRNELISLDDEDYLNIEKCSSEISKNNADENIQKKDIKACLERMESTPQPTTSTTPNPNVSVYVLINQGPVGQIYYSSDLFSNLLTKDNFVGAKIDSNFFYPSLYFDISATPNLSEESIKNRKLDLKWMDVEITLNKVCKKGRDYNKEPCTLWLVDMYPNDSESSTKDHPLVTGVKTAQELASLTSAFFPSVAGQALNAKIGAGTDGLSVLFSNLLPPIVKSHFYPRIIKGRSFGWTFSQDPNRVNPTLMGLQRGVVFLQAGKGLEEIEVRYKVKTLWNKNVDSTNGKLNIHKRTYRIPLSKLASPVAVDPTKFKSLKDYPALIKMSDVCKMFSIDDEACKRKSQFDLIKSYLQGEDAKLNVSHPMTAVCKDSSPDCEIEPDKILFKRSALQMYLDIDQEIEESKQDKN